MNEGEVAVAVPQNFGLQTTRDPKAVLAEAKRAAEALTAVMKAIPEDKKVMMGGEQYLEVEHWGLIAAFYRCTPKILSTEPIEYGDARGFLAHAALLDAAGREISAADAMCLNDEPKWATRPKYDWVDGKKTLVGEVPVPANQLRSMAQTRAVAKVCRNVFSWVVVLAGYAPTPADEITGDEVPPAQPGVKPAAPKAPTTDALQTFNDTVADVAFRDVNTKNGKSQVATITTGTGKKLEFWVSYPNEKAMAEHAVAIKGTTTEASFGFVTDKYGMKMKTLEVQPAAAEA